MQKSSVRSDVASVLSGNGYLAASHALRGFLPGPTRGRVYRHMCAHTCVELSSRGVSVYKEAWDCARAGAQGTHRDGSTTASPRGRAVISGYRIALFILFNDTDLCVE